MALIGRTICPDFNTYHPKTGVATVADSTPSYSVYKNDSGTPLSLSGNSIAVRSGTTSNYVITLPLTVGNGFTHGDTFILKVSVTVAGITKIVTLLTFIATTYEADSIVQGSDNKVLLSNNAHTGATIPTVTTVTNDVGITQAGADKAWSTATRVLTAGTNIALAKGTGVTGFNDISTTDVATAVWNAATATYGTAGSYGLLVETNLDAAVSSITVPTTGAIADAVWNEAIADHLGAGSTGLALNSASSAGDPWSTAVPGAYGAGTAGYILGTNLNTTVSSRSTHSAADVWSVATRVLTAGTNIALAKGTGVTGFNDISTTDVATAVWNAATATYGTAGSYGLLVETNLDAAVSSKASQASVNDIPINPLLTNDSRLNNLDTTIGSRLASASYIAPDNSSITAIKLKTDNIQWGDITDIKDEALGKWVLDPDLNTLTLYRQDGVTILKTFSLTSTTQIVPAYIQRT